MMPDNKPDNKKKIILAVVAIVAVIAVAVGTVIILSLVNKKTTDNNPVQTVKTAADIRQEAIELIHSDKEKAKALLEESLAKFKAEGDINGQIDIESQLDYLEQTK